MRTTALLKSASLGAIMLVTLQALPATGSDLPKRKSGLWEVKTQMEGRPAHTMQMCIDSKTDDMMRSRGAEMQQQCKAWDVRHQGDKMLIHGECKMEGTTMISDSVLTGSLDSNYRMETATRYSPPFMGMSSSRIMVESKWLGPCKAGQKPGDIIGPGGVTISNMNNPGMSNMTPQEREKMQRAMREMMKNQRE